MGLQQRQNRSLHATMLASIIAAISYCVVEIILAWLPLSQLVAPLNTLLTIDAVFYVLSTTLLYWGIILRFRDCENTLYLETKGKAGKRVFWQTNIHALLFSLRVGLAGTNLGLKVVIGDEIDASRFTEESISFDMASLFLFTMVIDLFVSAFFLRRAMRDAGVNTKVWVHISFFL